MDSGEGGLSQNVVKFQSIGRLNSILVVSQKPEYLKRAGTWIARLDKSDTEAANMKSYPLRYGNSKLIVALLNEMLFGQARRRRSLDSASSQISPGAGVSVSSSRQSPVAALSGLPTAGAGAATPVTGRRSRLLRRGAPPRSARQRNMRTRTIGRRPVRASKGQPAAAASCQNVRITADVTNNAVLVYANKESQRIVEQTIRQIDRPQRQIAIEATIAEVTLNDQLNYGVQYFLASQKGSISQHHPRRGDQRHHRDRTGQQRRQCRRRRAARTRASRLQFPDRSRELAARHSRRAA